MYCEKYNIDPNKQSCNKQSCEDYKKCRNLYENRTDTTIDINNNEKIKDKLEDRSLFPVHNLSYFQNLSYDEFKLDWENNLINKKDIKNDTQKQGSRFAEYFCREFYNINKFDGLIRLDSKDGGIDIAFMKKGQHNTVWYVVQSKYWENLSKGEISPEFNKFLNTYIGINKNISEKAKKLFNSLHTFNDESSKNDKLIYVWLTKDETPDKREFEKCEILGKEYFKNIEFMTESVSLKSLYHRKRKDYEIEIRANLVTPNSRNFYGYTYIYDIYKLIQKHTQEMGIGAILKYNVRYYLDETESNKGILKTLEKLEDSKKFGDRNNGITITCKDVVYDNENKKIKLISPFISNGAQTSYSIYKSLNEQKHERDIETIFSNDNRTFNINIIKIGNDDDNEYNEITQYRNTQNRVTKATFLSLGKNDFKKIKEELINKYKMYLQVYDGEWKTLELMGDDLRYNFNCVASDMLRFFGCAWLDTPGYAKHHNEYIPGEDVYKIMMEYYKLGTEDIYSSYLLSKIADKYKKEENYVNDGKLLITRPYTMFLFTAVFVRIIKNIINISDIRTTRDSSVKKKLCFNWKYSKDDANNLKKIIDKVCDIKLDMKNISVDNTISPNLLKIKDDKNDILLTLNNENNNIKIEILSENKTMNNVLVSNADDGELRVLIRKDKEKTEYNYNNISLDEKEKITKAIKMIHERKDIEDILYNYAKVIVDQYIGTKKEESLVHKEDDPAITNKGSIDDFLGKNACNTNTKIIKGLYTFMKENLKKQNKDIIDTIIDMVK